MCRDLHRRRRHRRVPPPARECPPSPRGRSSRTSRRGDQLLRQVRGGVSTTGGRVPRCGQPGYLRRGGGQCAAGHAMGDTLLRLASTGAMGVGTSPDPFGYTHRAVRPPNNPVLGRGASASASDPPGWTPTARSAISPRLIPLSRAVTSAASSCSSTIHWSHW